EGPSAPPPGWLEDIHGYQGNNKGGESETDVKPNQFVSDKSSELHEEHRAILLFSCRVPSVSEDVAREALLKFVESKWKYSSKPARNLTFKTLKPITVYRVRVPLSLFYHYSNDKLYASELISVFLTPALPFPQKRCTFCHGHGRARNKRCTRCHGRGRKRKHRMMFHIFLFTSRCLSCRGDGYKTCSVCHGAQNLLHFIQLTVTWKNNVSNFIPDRQPDFPDKKFEKVSGDPFFIDENVLVKQPLLLCMIKFQMLNSLS
uniref:CR-type domain-containing protein n=1 Tax=Cyprinodon variegatus TaxID=28743 RepID=A0A3Q2C648_CYPVA